MMSVLRVVLAVAVSSISVAASAATAHRQAPDPFADVFIGLDMQEQHFFTQIHSLFPQDIFDISESCRCDDKNTSVPELLENHGSGRDECRYTTAGTAYVHDHYCRCGEPSSFRVVDDGIRNQLDFIEDPLAILPLWEIDTALEIEEPLQLAWDDSGCGSRSIRTIGGLDGGRGLTSGRSLGLSASSSFGAGGLAGAISGGGLIGGGSSGGSGSLVDVSPPVENSPTFETPVPTPLPPAGLLFLSALSALGLLGGLRRRFAAKS